jgi:peptidylprolyl isomerase
MAEKTKPVKKDIKVEKKAVSSDRPVKSGDFICVNYTGKLDSGEVFDSSESRAPLEFTVGSGQLIKGFDTAVVGMKVGDKKTIKLPPAEAYGDRDERRIQKFPRAKLPKEPEPKPGMMLTITTPNGMVLPAKIAGVDDDSVMIDFNHPLAGKTLIFDISVVCIKDKPPEHEHGCGCGCE